jgi:hypothetical protein
MKSLPLLLFLFTFCQAVFSQQSRQDIYTDFVLYNKRQRLETDLKENIIGRTFSLAIDTDNEYRFGAACRAVSQFLVKSDIVKQGLQKMCSSYDSLERDTKQSMIEAIYTNYPSEFSSELTDIFNRESDPLLFAQEACYLYRFDSSIDHCNQIKIRMVEQFPSYDSIDVLLSLESYLNNDHQFRKNKTPDLSSLFLMQASKGRKTIYSFQRWNRDYPGLAIVQNADGSFMRDENKRLLVFRQLARSASNLPFFVRNGNTPQGIYSIRGTAVANNHFIGPTPNIQLTMPFENKWSTFFHLPDTLVVDSVSAYRDLLPESWKNYTPIYESWIAGKIGRTGIIAHGTTLDPEYFKGQPYYPLTPTMGCLCAKEIWNVTSGRPLISEQFNLVQAFRSATGDAGYLFVINLDDQQKPVERQEVEIIVGSK